MHPAAVALLFAGIIGGEEASSSEWPGVVSLGDCTGTLIHPRMIVFAAHCELPGSVVFGAIERCERYPGGSVRSGEDFAYCLLAEPQPRSIVVEPLTEREMGWIRPGSPATIVGFGLSESGQRGVKRSGDTAIRCSTPRGELIAGGADVDSCAGDSGGPLFVRVDGIWRLAGVTSFGARCGEGGFYGRIDRALPWLEESSGLDLSCDDCAEAPAPIVIDALPPRLRSSGRPTEAEDGPVPTLRLPVVAGDPPGGCGVKLIRVEVDGEARPPVVARSGPSEVAVALEPGAHSVSLQPEDWAGNRGEAIAVPIVAPTGCTCAGQRSGELPIWLFGFVACCALILNDRFYWTAAGARRHQRSMLRLVLIAVVGCHADVAPPDASDPSDAARADAAADAGAELDAEVAPDASAEDASAEDASAEDATVADAGVAPSMSRVGGTFDIASIAAATPKRFVEASYDPDHQLYLVVHGNAAIGGAFLDEAGAMRGAPFPIADTASWTQAPRLVYGDGAFLVTWHDTRNDPNLASVYARLVAFDGAQERFLSPGFAVTAQGSNGEMPPSVAYSIASREFLVTWQNVPEGTLSGQRIDAAGGLIGAEIPIAGLPEWHGDPNVVWNPESDEFYVVFTAYADGVGASVGGVRIRAGTGEITAGETIGRAAGTWIPQIAYTPTTQRFFVVWYDGAIEGRLIDLEGTPIGDPFLVAPGYGAYDGLSLSYNSALDRYGAVFHGTNDEDWACAIATDGSFGTPLQATESPGEEGNFNPRIIAHGARGEWLVVSARGFATVVGQILGE